MRFAKCLARGATTLLGVILAVTPVALWIAWSATLVIAIMAIAMLSALLLAALTESGAPRHDGASGRVALPEEFIDEVHRLFPLTYHHSAAGPSRFQRAMSRLAHMMDQK